MKTRMKLPPLFTASTSTLLGEENYEMLAEALTQEPSVSIRMNGVEPPQEAMPVPWCANGYYLDRRLTFTFDPLFHAGCYYVQEASSMFVEQAMKQYVSAEPVRMLDLCAAPGGKSTLVRGLLPEGSLLVANEVMRNRVQVLAENVTKAGHPDVVVTNNDPVDFASLTDFFDVLLTDVPCSGEGMFRKDPGAIDEWSPANVDLCAQRQRRILTDCWPCLKPGGILIYSTCTYNTCEDEENVAWMVRTFGAEVLPLEVSHEWGVTGNLLAGADFPVYRFLPHRTRGEGFFLAVVRKPGGEDFRANLPGIPVRKKKKNRAAPPSAADKDRCVVVRGWLSDPDAYTLTVAADGLAAFALRHEEALALLSDSLRVVQAGVALAEVKGKDLLPRHALAMSRLLRPGTFPVVAVDYEAAIAYLRKEALSLPEDAPRGYVLLAYRGVKLGFVKNVGNRANNLYPPEWRIRSSYLPEEVRTL